MFEENSKFEQIQYQENLKENNVKKPSLSNFISYVVQFLIIFLGYYFLMDLFLFFRYYTTFQKAINSFILSSILLFISFNSKKSFIKSIFLLLGSFTIPFFIQYMQALSGFWFSNDNLSIKEGNLSLILFNVLTLIILFILFYISKNQILFLPITIFLLSLISSIFNLYYNNKPFFIALNFRLNIILIGILFILGLYFLLSKNNKNKKIGVLFLLLVFAIILAFIIIIAFVLFSFTDG